MINTQCNNTYAITARSTGNAAAVPYRRTPDRPNRRWCWALLVLGGCLGGVAASCVPGTHNRTVVIAIDPGHGGRDPGATAHGVKEKNVTLAIGKDLATLIGRHHGMRAVLTRHGDYYVGLRQRDNIARRAGADLFISIHCDAGKPRWNWATVYTQKHDPTADASDRLGDDITAALRHIERTDHDRTANFAVLRAARIPAVLVETGYITNPHQARQLSRVSFQHRLARAIFSGIQHYLRR